MHGCRVMAKNIFFSMAAILSVKISNNSHIFCFSPSLFQHTKFQLRWVIWIFGTFQDEILLFKI